ncbi:MAG: alpha/beta hydrolase [Chitinophagaceae bacterium]|nr:alpha/beta hydrolase [Chitinophagaceae bacterium]
MVRMKRTGVIVLAVILLSLFLCRCVIVKMRWSDSKAHRVFKSKQVPLDIWDTVIDNRHIHYAVSGPDTLPTLVFVHGSPGSWFHYMMFMWDDSLRKKFRIISFDRPGFGYSDYGKAAHLQDQCELILPVLKRLKTDRPMFLCGHSYGGPVVAKLAADAPDLFKKIIITAGSLDPGLEKKETWRHVMDKKPLFWFLPGAFQPSNTELLYLKEDLKPLTKDLDKITTQVIFVHGDKDTWVPIENVAYGKKMMVNASGIRIDTIKGAGHQIPWKNQEDFKKILLALE